MVFVQLQDIHVGVNFGVVDNLPVLLLLTTSFIESFVKGIFLINRGIVAICSHPVVITSVYKPARHPVPIL